MLAKNALCFAESSFFKYDALLLPLIPKKKKNHKIKKRVDSSLLGAPVYEITT